MGEQRKYWDEDIEAAGRERLLAAQLGSLKGIVAHAYENSPYYRRAWDAAGVDPYGIRMLKDIERFPFIDKRTQRDAQGVGSFLGELAAVPEEDVVFVSTSSGSTGVPTMSPFTKRDFDEFQDVESRIFWMAGLRRHDRYIHALNFSLYVGGPDVIGAQNLGALCIWGGTLPSERLIFILKEYRPTAIWTSPSYAWQLGEAAKKAGIDPKRDFGIKRIFVAGELGGSIPATRSAIEDLWGAELFDFYGLSDIFGACAGQCEAHDGLHIAEDHILVETVDIDTGRVLPIGARGELVFTTLRKRARPLIRFRTGDIGRFVTAPCSCGRTLGRIYIDGRKDDMFIVSAVNVYPSDIEYVVRGLPGVTGEYTIRIAEDGFATYYEVSVERAGDVGAGSRAGSAMAGGGDAGGSGDAGGGLADPRSEAAPHQKREIAGAGGGDAGGGETDAQLAERVSAALKARIGVKPRRVIVLPDGSIERSTHKAKRVIDERKKALWQKEGI